MNSLEQMVKNVEEMKYKLYSQDYGNKIKVLIFAGFILLAVISYYLGWLFVARVMLIIIVLQLLSFIKFGYRILKKKYF